MATGSSLDKDTNTWTFHQNLWRSLVASLKSLFCSQNYLELSEKDEEVVYQSEEERDTKPPPNEKQNYLESSEKEEEVVYQSEEERDTEPPPNKKLWMLAGVLENREVVSFSSSHSTTTAGASSQISDSTVSKLWAPVPIKSTVPEPWAPVPIKSMTRPSQFSFIAMDMRSIDDKIATMGKVFTKIRYFHHITTPGHKASIVQDKKLKRNMTKLLYQSMNSPINQRLEGVFLGCNTIRGMLPSKSPYGSERILIPIEKFSSKEYHLFYNSNHSVGQINYIVLVLVKEDATDYQFCYENLVKLDVKMNPFLCLDFENNSFSCCQTRPIPTWVEILVVEEVFLEKEDGHRWDTVTDIGRSRSNRTIGRRLPFDSF